MRPFRWFTRPMADTSEDKGVALVELLIALPVLMMIALGVVEMAMSWKASTDVSGAVRDAGRIGSSAGPSQAADQLILQSMAAGLNSSEMSNVQFVMVYKSTTADGKPSSACRALVSVSQLPITGSTTRGVAGQCNVYSKTQMELTVMDTANNNFGGTPGAWDSNWAPASRSNNTQAATGSDWQGVAVGTVHPSVTHSFWPDATISKYSVFRLEPAYRLN